MTDTFAQFTPGLESPATHGFVIVPHDTDELAYIPRLVHVTGNGDAEVILKDDTAAITLVGLTAGQWLFIRPKVVTTATTATLVGLY